LLYKVFNKSNFKLYVRLFLKFDYKLDIVKENGLQFISLHFT